jgi:hypothetical protein
MRPENPVLCPLAFCVPITTTMTNPSQPFSGLTLNTLADFGQHLSLTIVL